MTIVILGGTAEARALAQCLVDERLDVLSTLAGRVRDPRLPAGRVRIGGFGGVEGLVRFLRDTRAFAVVDATHPFAAGMSRNAVAACASTGVPLLRLQRTGWADEPGAETWTWVDSHAEAAGVATEYSRPFLTVGRQALPDFIEPLRNASALVRVVDMPDFELPDAWTTLGDRGPYDLVGERGLLQSERVDALVTKDSGGTYTWPKVAAAAELGVDVVIVRRPDPVQGVERVTSAAAAARWVVGR